ncbi:hypothetical protein ACLMJK_009660 [Lecanora helva]
MPHSKHTMGSRLSTKSMFKDLKKQHAKREGLPSPEDSPERSFVSLQEDKPEVHKFPPGLANWAPKYLPPRRFDLTSIKTGPYSGPPLHSLRRRRKQCVTNILATKRALAAALAECKRRGRTEVEARVGQKNRKHRTEFWEESNSRGAVGEWDGRASGDPGERRGTGWREYGEGVNQRNRGR